MKRRSGLLIGLVVVVPIAVRHGHQRNAGAQDLERRRGAPVRDHERAAGVELPKRGDEAFVRQVVWHIGALAGLDQPIARGEGRNELVGCLGEVVEAGRSDGDQQVLEARGGAHISLPA